MTAKVRVLALAPYCDGTDVGEAWCAFQWVSNLAQRADVTLLTLKREGWTPPSSQLPNVEVVEWDELRPGPRFDRLNSMMKPGYIHYWVAAYRWIRRALAAGRCFDVAHQFTPIALRYPSPLACFDIPYVLGPLGGSLDTPPGFAHECQSASWFTRLRGIDRLRLRHDPLLKHTYAQAAAVVGVAPYVGEQLRFAEPQRFEVMSELGIAELAAECKSKPGSGSLQLLHVGRGVRTKGLRDAVRAMAHLPANLRVHLHAAGQGEEIAICQQEAQRLGVADKITFHGQIPRADVERLYARADLFVFPSFREPSGSVVFEALRNGLPIITTNTGGPGFVVDDSCGIRLAAQDPDQLAEDLARAIGDLASNPQRLQQLAAGARERIAAIGLWQNKLDWLMKLYTDVAQVEEAGAQHPRQKEVVQHA